MPAAPGTPASALEVARAAASPARAAAGVRGAVAKVASVGSSLRSGLLSFSSARSVNKDNSRAEAAAPGAVPAKELATGEPLPDAVGVGAGPLPEAVAASNTSSSSRSRAVLLLTDGEANVGVCDPQTIIRMASSAISSQAPGARLITFEYRAGHNTSLLEQLAVGSGGSYRFVENEDQVAGAFADCLGGLTSVAAQAVRVVVRGAGGARLCAAPLTRFPCLVLPGAAWQVDIPDLFQGEQRNLPVQCSSRCPR
jgi:hypothetical protein